MVNKFNNYIILFLFSYGIISIFMYFLKMAKVIKGLEYKYKCIYV
jgi:hypothetical protein